jgi:hypothetical protein
MHAENQDNTDGKGCALFPGILSAFSRHIDPGEIHQDDRALTLRRAEGAGYATGGL